jgi:hypothetical protein
LRARYRLRTPDAIQLATGLQAGATLVVTNDEAWRNVSMIETVILPTWSGKRGRQVDELPSFPLFLRQ